MRPLIVPEAATVTILGGVPPQALSPFDFQVALTKMHFYLEDHFAGLARACNDDRDTVILCDRGILDGKAFSSPENWGRVLDALGVSEDTIRATRYDAVVHMVTAADGAREFYTLENNNAREESPEQAIAVDRLLQAAWLGHPAKLRVIDNSTGFSQKIQRVGDEVCKILGVSGASGTKKVFRLPLKAGLALKKSGFVLAGVEITQSYLRSEPGEERRLRKRKVDGCESYFYSTLRTLDGVPPLREERIITRSEFKDFSKEADPARTTIHKMRYSYLYDGAHHELDVFHTPRIGFCLLEVDADRVSSLPLFQIEAIDVSGQDCYDNANIAKKDWVNPIKES